VSNERRDTAPAPDNDVPAEHLEMDEPGGSQSVPSDDDLKEWVKHYADQFWTGANRANTILVTWGASLLVIFAALVPLSGRVSQYDVKYSNYENALQKLARDEAQTRTEFERRRANLNERSETTTQLDNQLKATQETFKERRAQLEKRFQSIRTLKSDLLPFNVPLGKIDIAVSYSPLLWICLFTFFLGYFFFRRLALIATLSQLVHIQVDMRGRPIGSLKGLGSGAPFWLAPLPGSVTGSRVSVDDLRAFLGWGPRSSKTTLTYMFLTVAVSLYVWVGIISIQVVKIYDNPKLRLGFVLCIAGTFTLLMLICWTTLRTRLQLEKYPEALMQDSNRRRVLIGLSSSLIAVGYFYIFAPRKVFPRRLVPRSNRSKYLADRRHDRRLSGTVDPVWRGRYYLNERTNFVHYIKSNGNAKTLTVKVRHKRFVPYTKDDVFKLLIKDHPQMESESDKPKNEDKALSRSKKAAGALAQKKPTELVAKATTTALPARMKASPKSAPPVVPPVAEISTNGESASTEKRPDIRIASRQVGVIAEALALEKLRSGDANAALTIVWTAINQSGRSKSNQRLYDLYASIALKHSRADELKKLIEHVSNDKNMVKRIEKWKAPTRRWQMKARDVEQTWKMPENAM
jgi:hypothetical protein